jgi:acetoin utilization protein AcuB
MIVSEVMTTELVTVTPGDTLSHAANLLRQYTFHHLPVVKPSHTQRTWITERQTQQSKAVLEGLLTSQDIEMAVAMGTQSSGGAVQRPWQEQHVAEVMHSASITVTPTTSVAAAAQLLVERGLNCLPVVDYVDVEGREQDAEGESPAVLVGLLTRSDILMAMARALGAFQPGMELRIPLPAGDMTPLTNLLLLTEELHIKVQSILAGPLEGNLPRVATVRLGTIYPTPLLLRLHEKNIQYTFVDPQLKGGSDDKRVN